MNSSKVLRNLISLIQSLRIAEDKETQLDQINCGLIELGLSPAHAARVIVSLETFNNKDFQLFQYHLDISPDVAKQLDAIFWISNNPTSSIRQAAHQRMRAQLQ